MKLEYSVVYSDRKTLGITVERDRKVLVRAPHEATSKQIERAVEQKKLWLFEKLRHPQKYDPGTPLNKEVVSGESLAYLGRHYRLEIIDETFDGVRFSNRFYLSRQSQDEAANLLKAWFREQAREKITPLVEEVARALGVAYNNILISDLKYRWGSCTPNDNLNFNWRLIKAPIYVIKYVVAHELAHLIEPNHTERFWNIVYIQAPRYEKAKTWLKEQGSSLFADL
jgi:predicted metal-dependent hydrolase